MDADAAGSADASQGEAATMIGTPDAATVDVTLTGKSCTPNAVLPAGSPALAVGVWTNISPAGVPFDANATAFGQGITLDPCDVGTLYLAVVGFDPAKANAGIYKSTNAGSTWTRVGQLDEPINVSVDPRNPRHLYASDGVRGSTMGFWVSADGGNHWTLPDGFNTAARSVNGCCDVYHVEPDPADFDHVLVSFHSGSWNVSGAAGILESFDGGASWIVHQPIVDWAWKGGYDVFFLRNPDLGLGDAKTWLFGTQGIGYWRTADAGTTWTKVTDVSMDHGGGQLYYTKSGVLYASGTPNIIRSMDNGLTWTKLTSGAFLSVTGDGNTLYTGNHGGGSFVTAMESNDATWSNFNSQTFAEGPFEMAFDSVNRILYSSNIRSGAWALKVK
jgi:hypothetical protein